MAAPSTTGRPRVTGSPGWFGADQPFSCRYGDPVPSFFTSAGPGRVRATEHTVGPWDERHQHGGPPSALVVRAMEQALGERPGQVCRVTCELLGPIPIGELEVAASVVRDGRSVRMVEGVLRAGGRDLLTARAWWISRGDTVAVTGAPAGEEPPPDPQSCPAVALAVAGGSIAGYLGAMEWRSSTPVPPVSGAALVWARSLLPLVDEEAPSPLARVLLAADSGNGISSPLPIRDWLFINPELSVHLVRAPVGEWVALSARTLVGGTGVGLAETALWDEQGRIGRGAQSLLVAPRS